MNDQEMLKMAEQVEGLHELVEVLLLNCDCCATATKKEKK
jgi:hypothetical protein